MSTKSFSTGRHIGFGLIVMGFLLLGFGTWASLSKIEGAIILSAVIEPLGGRHLIQHPQGGKILKLTAHEGDDFRAGEILAELDASAIASELTALEHQMAALQAQKSRALAERAGEEPPKAGLQNALFRARQNIQDQEHLLLDRQISQIEQQISGITAQTAALFRQRHLIEAERKTYEQLYQKGLSQIGPLLALQREEARLIGQEGELSAAHASAQERLAEREAYRKRLTFQLDETILTELNDLEVSLAALTAKHSILSQTYEARLIRAPFDGSIIAVTRKSLLQPGETLFEVLPKNAILIAAAEIQPLHIDEIHPNQRAKLILSGVNARLQPPLEGRVRMISPDLHYRADRPASYHLEITLPPAQPLEDDLKIMAGMPVEVFIATSARSPLNWLWQPIEDYFRRAMRES